MSKNSAKKAAAEIAPSLISNSKLQQIYAAMLKCHILDSQVRSLGGGSSWKGREAAAVGAAIDLQPEDAIIFSSGSAVARFLRGVPLPSIFKELHAASAAGSQKKRKPLAGAGSPPQSALATGIAYAQKSLNKGNVALAFLSENPENGTAGCTALQFASAHKLPIIYVYSGEHVDLPQMHDYGLPAIPVDGNDVVAVYRVVYECLTRARQGGGPSVITCNFSKNGSVANGLASLRNMEQYLLEKGLFSNVRKQSTIRAFEKAVAQAKAAADKVPQRQKAQHQKNGYESGHLFMM